MSITYKTLRDRTIFIIHDDKADYYAITMLSNGMILLDNKLDSSKAKMILSSYLKAGAKLQEAR